MLRRMAVFALVLFLVFVTSHTAWASDMVGMHNSARASAGLSKLTVDGNLSAGALAYSQQMADKNKLAHSSPGIRPGGYRQVVENVGKVRADTGQSGMFEMFMNSSSHRPNIMHPDVTHIGVGIVTDERGVIWATVWFGVGSKPKPEPAPEPEPDAKPAPKSKPEPTKSAPAPEPTPEPEPVQAQPEPEPEPEPEIMQYSIPYRRGMYY